MFNHIKLAEDTAKRDLKDMGAGTGIGILGGTALGGGLVAGKYGLESRAHAKKINEATKKLDALQQLSSEAAGRVNQDYKVLRLKENLLKQMKVQGLGAQNPYYKNMKNKIFQTNTSIDSKRKALEAVGKDFADQAGHVSQAIKDKKEALKAIRGGLKRTAGIGGLVGGGMGLALGAVKSIKRNAGQEKTSSYLYKVAAEIRSNQDAALAHDTYNDAHVSPKERLKAYKEWRDYTSNQDPKSKLKSSLKGAVGYGLAGAGMGALTGLHSGMGVPGAIVGGGAGALVGGLSGLGSAMRHNNRISEARSKMHLDDDDTMSHIERSTARNRAMEARALKEERNFDRTMSNLDRLERMHMRRELMKKDMGNVNYNVRL